MPIIKEGTRITFLNIKVIEKCQILQICYHLYFPCFLVHLSRRLTCTIVITRCPSVVRPSLTFHIFNFSSETAEQNSNKLDRKQDLNVLYQVFVFRADLKNKTAALTSDWLRQFRLLLWNHWMEFNKTWQEARSQCLLPSLCFSGWSGKQDGHAGLWFAETISTSPLKPLNGVQRNLTGSKISTSSTNFVFFGLIRKTRWPLSASGLWLAETFSTSPLKLLNAIERNLTGSNISTFSTKFVFFRVISKQKWLPWPPIPKKVGTLYSGARYVALWASYLKLHVVPFHVRRYDLFSLLYSSTWCRDYG